MRHCFAYGSLMHQPIMTEVCGVSLESEAALAHGFSRHPVVGEAYPGMISRPGSQVEGRLYRGLSAGAIARLDAFEGPQYQRCPILAVLADGTEVEADTYLFRPEHAHLLLPGDWDFAHFLAEGRHRFIHSYLGYQRL